MLQFPLTKNIILVEEAMKYIFHELFISNHGCQKELDMRRL